MYLSIRGQGSYQDELTYHFTVGQEVFIASRITLASLGGPNWVGGNFANVYFHFPNASYVGIRCVRMEGGGG